MLVQRSLNDNVRNRIYIKHGNISLTKRRLGIINDSGDDRDIVNTSARPIEKTNDHSIASTREKKLKQHLIRGNLFFVLSNGRKINVYDGDITLAQAMEDLEYIDQGGYNGNNYWIERDNYVKLINGNNILETIFEVTQIDE